jgi:cholesterol oxidase
MSYLSRPIEGIEDHYEVIVVGSGYGASIAASRLARAGRQVCLLERGREIRPGEYPDTLSEASADLQLDMPHEHKGTRTALMDFRVNADQNVLVGCGLGGTSLINANVSLRAEPRVFDDPRWPQAFVSDLGTRVEEGYQRAETMLKPRPYPQDMPRLPKMEALEKSAELLGQKWYRTPINVTFNDGVNHVGVEQKTCTLCGDCITGCNFSAKNTTLMNYLPDASNHGAHIFTRVSVRRVAKGSDGKWVVHYQLLNTGMELFDAPTMFVTADLVVLGAGTLGSTEILLRSAAHGLPLSPAVGQHFSGNGDVLGFGYNGDVKINGIGYGHRDLDPKEPVGPCITSVLDRREQPELEDGMVIEDGSIPGAMSSILPEMFEVADLIGGTSQEPSWWDEAEARIKKMFSGLMGSYKGAMNHTQTYLVMAHDGTEGRCYLDQDRLRISWPGVGQEPIFDQINDTLLKVNEHLSGTYVRDPLWTELLNEKIISVHPLGGCSMAENGEAGVVNHCGEVFSGVDSDIHEGLYVCDGSVVPRSLGVNPLLTISAIAERTAALIAEKKGWTIDYTLPSAPSAPSIVRKPGLQFTEAMKGYFSANPGLDYDRAYEAGKELNDPFQFVLKIRTEDVEQMLENPAHEARIVGTVEAPGLSDRPLTVTEGFFNLLKVDTTHVETRNMNYRMKLTSEDGKIWDFDGHKIIAEDSILKLWDQTTTLYFTVYAGTDEQAPVAGRGILHIKPLDFMKQMTTIKIPHAKSRRERLKWTSRFGHFFAGILFDTYGGIAEPTDYFDGATKNRKKRRLNAPTPEVHFIKTADEVELRLTRFPGGTRGPILLSPGLGITSDMFAVDTIEINLVEYLSAAGYDVWLFDWRGSPALASSRTQFSLDDVSKNDYQAAIPFVCEQTGVSEIDLLVHCIGSTTFFMAMCRGLQGVRSVIASQSALHLDGSKANELKCGLLVPTVLDTFGFHQLEATIDHVPHFGDRLWDRLMDINARIGAQGQCDNVVCHRATFMYGSNFEHDNLNQPTHDMMAEMFGSTNMTVYRQIAKCVRKNYVVDADGGNYYLEHLDGLQIPITFIHGAKNQLWLPSSTENTYTLLCDTFGSERYKRIEMPTYAHADNFFGRDSARDVYPIILENLERMRGR